MRIQKLKSKNYRTLQDIELNFTSNYCTLSGHNNAGKSAIVRLILHLFSDSEASPWSMQDYSISYDRDKTQWDLKSDPIKMEYSLCLNKSDDSSVRTLIEKFLGKTLCKEDISLDIVLEIDADNNKKTSAAVDSEYLDDVSRRELLKSLRSSNCLLLHNSTQNTAEWFVSRGRPALLYEFSLSEKDRQSISEAEGALQRKVQQVAKAHKIALGSMLDKLKDHYDVEFSTLDFPRSRRVPLTINLSDKNVELPLDYWGSGTQNRTHALLSILRANRIRGREAPDNRTTPIVLIEEPESFLHPSAQAEFGSVLQNLAEEEAIQIIVSTHSPFMLNQVDPQSNILLRRRAHRGKFLETQVQDTSGDEWMKPFAEHLGVIPEEFKSWRDVIGSPDTSLLLVEGETDKQYIEHMKEKFPNKFQLPSQIKVLPYGGKDALKNTMIISFVKQTVKKLFITFDLDAKEQVQRHLEQIGLQEKKDFIAIGKNRSGKRAIEGLLPDRIFQSVYGREIDLVSALSGTTEERKSASGKLKQKLLSEFKIHSDYTDEELRDFEILGKAISKALA